MGWDNSEWRISLDAASTKLNDFRTCTSKSRIFYHLWKALGTSKRDESTHRWGKGEVGSRFAAAQTVNVRSRAEEKKMFVAIRNDWRGYSEGRTYSGRNKYRSGLGRSLSIRYGNWMFRMEDRENRRCSQTILHRVLTVGKSIRDSRFDLYDQIPGGCIARGIERTSWDEQ